MKKLILLLFPMVSFAQTYPFDQGFAGIPSGSLPAGWNGDMKVQADHGLNDLKGMTADIGSADLEDSSITPWIGPLDNNTEFYFWYRIVDQFIYPSTEKHLNGKDRFVISYSTDSVNYIPVYTVDSTNHQATLNFKKVVFDITTLGGQTVKFKFWCKHGGGGSYFVDIDSIKVRESTGTGVRNTTEDIFSVSPNPVKSGQHITLRLNQSQSLQLSLFDVTGKVLSTIYLPASTTAYKLPVEDFAPGIYFLRCGNQTRKLVIEGR